MKGVITDTIDLLIRTDGVVCIFSMISLHFELGVDPNLVL